MYARHDMLVSHPAAMRRKAKLPESYEPWSILLTRGFDRDFLGSLIKG